MALPPLVRRPLGALQPLVAAQAQLPPLAAPQPPLASLALLLLLRLPLGLPSPPQLLAPPKPLGVALEGAALEA